MARITTYRQLAQEIIDAHYNGVPVPEAAISQRFVAERIAMLVAKAASRSAFANSNEGEVTYSNDQFISTFYNLTLSTDAVTQDKYVTMPATPAGLPNGREIAQVSFTGAPNAWIVPMANRMGFVESMLPKLPNDIILFRVENGRIVFQDLPAIITGNVNIKLVGAVPTGTTILDSLLNVPKDVEDDIFTTILNELVMNYKTQPTTINTGEPS